MNYVPFAERVIEMVVDLYRTTAHHPTVISEHVLQRVIKVGRAAHSYSTGLPTTESFLLLFCPPPPPISPAQPYDIPCHTVHEKHCKVMN